MKGHFEIHFLKQPCKSAIYNNAGRNASVNERVSVEILGLARETPCLAVAFPHFDN